MGLIKTLGPLRSREKQRVLKLDPGRGVSSPASMNSEPDPKAWAVAATLQVTEAQNRVTKHKYVPPSA